jgi:hypothetical protein
LVTEQGMQVDIDHSYQMCGQCHFRQKKDWVGGLTRRALKNGGRPYTHPPLSKSK